MNTMVIMNSRRAAGLPGIVLTALLMVIALTGCTGSQTAATAKGLPANGSAVKAAEFEAAMKQPKTVILDVRIPTEFASGHIADAINIDVNAADFTVQINALAKDVPYAVYCRSGSRSGAALKIMAKEGFTNTYHLAGGISAWTSSGRPVVA